MLAKNIKKAICLFDLIFYVPVNNCSDMSGRFPLLIAYIVYFRSVVTPVFIIKQLIHLSADLTIGSFGNFSRFCVIKISKTSKFSRFCMFLQ